jgi:hypothetical protein
MGLSTMKNIYGHKFIMPFQGDNLNDNIYTQGVAVGLGCDGLSARKTK